MTTTQQVALTAEQVAHRYNVAPATIIEWSKRGAMPFARSLNGVLRWFITDLEEWEATEFYKTLMARVHGQAVVTRSGRPKGTS